jgi:hypothetical protein
MPRSWVTKTRARFVARWISFRRRRFRHVHGFPASIRVFGHSLASDPETETKGDLRRQDHTNGSRVNEGVSLIGPHLFGLEHPPSDQRLVDRVRQLGLDPNLTHG